MDKRNSYRTLVGKPERKRPLGRPRRTWVDNIKMYLREIRWGGMDWIDLTEDREKWRALLNMVMNFGKFLSGCTTGGFSRRVQLHDIS
jgi:hypothetical protein